MTRTTGTSVSTDDARRLVQRFVRASGGAEAIGSGNGPGHIGRAALAIGSRTGGFFGTVGAHGAGAALANLGIEEWSARTPSEIRAALLEMLAPEAATQDEMDARSALAELLSEALDGATDAAAVAARLEELAAQGPSKLLPRYAALYVYAKFKKTFYEYEQQRKGQLPTNAMLDEVRKYLMLSAERAGRGMSEQAGRGGWEQTTRQFVGRLMQKALTVFCGED